MKNEIVIHPREEWNAEGVTEGFARNLAAGIVLHNMENANRTPSDDSATELALSLQISRDCQHQHIHENGWSDIGQNFTISRGGVIMEGRKGSLDASHLGQVSRGAHASGVTYFNQHFHGIELEGDLRQAFVITNAQRTALINLCAHLQGWAGNPANENWRIIPHCEVREGHTDCPGLLKDHMDEIRAAVRECLGELLTDAD